MFDILHETFIQHAFLAGTFIAVVTAVVGYFVVLRSQAFAAHALSHIGFAGAAGAAFFGVSSLVGMLTLTMAAALGIGLMEKRLQGRDIEIGMVLSFALGLGVLFLQLYTRGASQTLGVLFGSLLSASYFDVYLSAGLAVFVLVVMGVLFRPLLFVSIDPEVAAARGVPVRLISLVFMLVLGISVTEAVQVVGILLVFALLVAPAAAAQHITRRPASGLILTVGFGLLFTWGGLFLAVVGRFPVSFYIASLATITYFICVSIGHVLVPHRFAEPDHPHKEVRV